MKKFLFILISTLLIVSVLAVPCFASNANYTFTIPAGDYVFCETLDTTYLPFTNGPVFVSFGLFSSNLSEFSSIGYETFQDGIRFNFFYAYSDIDGSHYVNVYRVSNGVGNWVDDDYRYITFERDIVVNDIYFYSFLRANLYVVNNDNHFLLSDFLNPFLFVGQWISGAVSDLTLMFWTGNELTFVGILAVSALAFAVSFLIIGLISRFLRFRG